MNKISLIIPSYQSDITMLQQALECSDLFDETIIHLNDKETIAKISLPKNCKPIYREEHVTVQAALNESIYSASSEYILPFTDDDFFNRKNLTELLEIEKLNLIHHDIIHYPIYAGNEELGWNLWGISPYINFETLCEENTIPFSCIFKKDVWTKLRGYQEGEFSDWAFWLRAIKNDFKFKYWNQPIYYHRQQHKSTLAQKELKNFNKEEFLKRLYEKN